jgi:hypothetical protein
MTDQQLELIEQADALFEWIDSIMSQIAQNTLTKVFPDAVSEFHTPQYMYNSKFNQKDLLRYWERRRSYLEARHQVLTAGSELIVPNTDSAPTAAADTPPATRRSLPASQSPGDSPASESQAQAGSAPAPESPPSASRAKKAKKKSKRKGRARQTK